MTDRLNGYVVTLEKDIRTDDAEAITKAIQMLKGVLSVEPLVSEPKDHIAYTRAKQGVWEKLWKAYTDA